MVRQCRSPRGGDLGDEGEEWSEGVLATASRQKGAAAILAWAQRRDRPAGLPSTTRRCTRCSGSSSAKKHPRFAGGVLIAIRGGGGGVFGVGGGGGGWGGWGMNVSFLFEPDIEEDNTQHLSLFKGSCVKGGGNILT